MAFPKQPFLNGRSLQDAGNLSEASALHKLPKPANSSTHPLASIRNTSKSSACNSRFWTCGSRSGPVFHADFTLFHANFTQISRQFHGLLSAAAFQPKRNKNLLPRMKCKWGSLAAWKHVMHATTFIHSKWWFYNHHFWTCRRLPGYC